MQVENCSPIFTYAMNKPAAEMMYELMYDKGCNMLRVIDEVSSRL